jgi:mono/diheme cytochrome c family protein
MLAIRSIGPVLAGVLMLLAAGSASAARSVDGATMPPAAPPGTPTTEAPLEPPVPSDPASIGRGKALAEANCGVCHQIGPDGNHPYPTAPAFSELKRRYPVNDLAEALAEGIMSGHPAMPEFSFTTQQIDDLLAYLNSL